METVRQQKVSRLIQKELAEIFRSEARSTFEGAFITVTVVRVSPDMSVAKVYLSIMGTKDAQAILKIVQKNAIPIRKKIALIVKGQLRIIPEFTYFIDDSLDYAEKIEELLKK